MTSAKKYLYPMLCGLVLVACLGSGCEENAVESNGPGIDCDSAAALVVVANDSLGRQMYELIDETLENADSSFRPREIDFSGVNGLYEDALTYCPTNVDARFGSAFTGLMLFLADPDLSDLYDRFKYVYDTLSFNPFRYAKLLPQVNLGNALAPQELPLAARDFKDILPALISLDHAVVALAGDDPMISEIQDILENSLLPRVVNSRDNLIEVLNHSDFTFIITPAMQGNHGASPVLLDRSDFRVILATLYAAEAALHIVVARELDLSEYSAAGAEEALAQNSSFLSLKGGGVGANHMATAKSRILSAEAELETAIDHLLSEIGTDQTNHLIKVYPEDAQDLEDAKDTLQYYRTYFDGPKELQIIWTDYWECDPYYNCWPVKDTFTTIVDVSKFFDDPWENPKEYLPAYTVTLEALDNRYKQYADTHFDRDRYWAAMDSIFGLTRPNDTPYFNYHLPDQDTDEFYRLLADYDSRQQFVFGWDDVYKYYPSCPATSLWCYESYAMYTYRWRWEEPDQIAACYVWQANTFAEWTWPYPTFNGLMPEMTSDEIKELLLDDGSDWKKSDCDTTGLNW